MSELDKKNRIRELTDALNKASEAYYGGREEIMSNYEWDSKFDELKRLEIETGFSMPDSPIQSVSFSSEEIGQKEAHEFPALSLAKTKSISDLTQWAGDKEIWVSWKLDGLTLVLTYDQGALTRILTRGNGSVGTNITYMKGAIRGIPLKLDYPGHLVVRGEALISYPDFAAVNAEMEDGEEKYANPRNLASGTLSLDIRNIDIVRKRRLSFQAFTLVYADQAPISWGKRMDTLKELGFSVVDREKTNSAGLPEVVQRWTDRVAQFQYPVDGLVITYDDTEYASTGSVTGHHATRAGLAFKWKDNSALTTLDHVEWSCAASSITPVAVFAPVQLEGTTVTRASLVNISEMERLGIGDNGKTVLEIIKSNKIIPKCIAVKERAGQFVLPEKCPVCNAPTEVCISVGGTKTLRCTNPDCTAKHLKRFVRFVSKDGLDIDGLSVETLRDLIAAGLIHEYADLWHLQQHVDVIAKMDGYGDRSIRKLFDAIEKSRTASADHLINALSIPQIGVDASRRIIRSIGWEGFLERSYEIGFADIDGIGAERSAAILEWMRTNRDMLFRLLPELKLQKTEPLAQAAGSCAGLTFVITGDLYRFANRDAMKSYVDRQGGKVAGSVSGKTSFLINNDINSVSSKNKRAKELGIPILTEDQFIEQFGFDQ